MSDAAAAVAAADRPITYEEIWRTLFVAAERIGIVQAALVEAGRAALAQGGMEAVRAGGHILTADPRQLREQKVLELAAKTFERILADARLRARLKEIAADERAAAAAEAERREALEARP